MYCGCKSQKLTTKIGATDDEIGVCPDCSMRLTDRQIMRRIYMAAIRGAAPTTLPTVKALPPPPPEHEERAVVESGEPPTEGGATEEPEKGEWCGFAFNDILGRHCGLPKGHAGPHQPERVGPSP